MSSTTQIRDVIGTPPYAPENGHTFVAWGAVIAGAFVAAAVSLILLILGSALGLSSASPWSRGETVAAFTVNAAIWLIVMQWVASAVGGYLTGRMRHKWVGMHNDEVYFRDTAHGFLTWAVATVLTATILASTTASIVSGGVHAGTAIAAGGAAGAASAPPPPGGPRPDNFGEANGYYIDTLFRATPATTGNGSMPANPPVDPKDTRAETTRILAMGIKNGSVPDADKAYVAQLVSARTGVSNADASKRVDDVIAQLNDAKEKAKQAAEEARKTAMHVSIYIFLSLLVGAFIASAAAALGGIHRDVY